MRIREDPDADGLPLARPLIGSQIVAHPGAGFGSEPGRT